MTTETNADRLAHIQYQIDDARLHGGMYSSTHVELEWLIQQAERAQELEQEKEFFRRSLVELKAGDVITRKDNARLREALADIRRSLFAELAPAMTRDVKYYLSDKINETLGGESK